MRSLINPKTLKKSYFLLGTIFMIFWFYSNITNIPSCREQMQTLLPLNYQGVVDKIFIDSLNHLNKTIVLKTINGNLEKYTFNRDKSGLFENVQKGDSLSKVMNSYIVEIYRNEDKRLFHLDFKCKD